jgi:general secretion pathway protein D
MIDFRGVDLKDVLQMYAELVHRTVLRSGQLGAQQIILKSETPLTKSEAIQALDAILAMNGIAMINVGEKFVKAVQTQTAGQEGAPIKTNAASSLPEIGQYLTHIVQLKYAKPSEMVQVLQPFSKIPNAVVPIESSQILVLRDFTENVKRMLEMIERVDVAIPTEFINEVIPIKYALASDISSALNSLSTGGGGATVGKATTTGARSSFGGASGFGGSRTMGGTSGYPGQQYGGGINPSATAAQPAGTTGGSFTDRLQNIIRRANATGEIQVLGQTKIIADERTNSLLIFASREDMKQIKDIVSKLDVVLAQVLIEAVILEVTLGPNTKDFGVSYLQHPQTSGNVTGVGAINKPIYSIANFLTPGANGSTNAAGGLNGGFNYLASFGGNLDVAISAVAGDSRAKVLQRPRIQTSHAVQAQLFVGESRPYPTSSYYGGGAYGSYASIQQLQIGVTLDVTPLINPDGLVVMDIHQTIENYAGFTEISGVGQVPNTTRKEAAAKVAVRDHDTIILGGLIETDKSKSGTGVPYLMDMPIIGPLFRSTSTSETRKELIVLIRPTVLPTPEVAALTARVEKDKMPGVRRAESEFEEEEAKRQRQSDAEYERLHPGKPGQ